jgi:polyphosphate kinase
LVVRRQDDGVRRYCHLGTGNYNPNTARVYTDLGLFTSNAEIGRDVSEIFNYLTSYAQPAAMRNLLVAPFSLHKGIVDRIHRETEHARAGRPARILGKMNALVDKDVIDALYAASCAGVKIDLIVRGICCLRPGMAGLSENIHVRSIVGRFLEHSRIFAFENGGEPDVWLGSADWMPRNFFGRVEVVFPVLTTALRARVLDEILGTYLRDTLQARVLQADGTWVRLRPPGAVDGGAAVDGIASQTELLRLTRARASERPAGPVAPKRGRKAPRAAEFTRERGS